MTTRLNLKIGAQPINWSNDDFHELGGQTPLETCLSEMRESGYVGTELGHKFPKDPQVLKPILNKYGLELISGWHSSYLATNPIEKEIKDFESHLKFLSQMGSNVIIVAECSHRTYHDGRGRLNWDREEAEKLSADDWKQVFKGLEKFADIAEDAGLKLVYHHHMGTVIQNLPDIDRLMESTKKVWLLGDTGHLAFAGENPLEVFKKYSTRIGHVHLKNIRPSIVKYAKQNKLTFKEAVIEGAFTVPGDGGIDYSPIFKLLENVNYSGWLVVEAEQDPQKANPMEYAKKARAYLKKEIQL